MKRKYIYSGTKRSIVQGVLNGYYTIERAAFLVGVQPATVQQWLNTFGREFLGTPTANKTSNQPVKNLVS